jgi:guanylate kinase
MLLKNIILSSPSGGGKTMVTEHLLKHGFEKSISYTTRLPRPNEKNGVDYWFVTVDEFKEFEKNGLFLETNEVYENIFYGTPIRTNISDKIMIYIMDAEGALLVKNKLKDYAMIFLDVEENTLIDRLNRRGKDDSYEKRVNKIKYELGLKNKFHKVIDNNSDIEKTIKDILEYTQHFNVSSI